jgi:hypothetical protein
VHKAAVLEKHGGILLCSESASINLLTPAKGHQQVIQMSARLVAALFLSMLLVSCAQPEESKPFMQQSTPPKPVQHKKPPQPESKPAPILVQSVVQTTQEINVAVVVPPQSPQPKPAPTAPSQESLLREEDMRSFGMLNPLEQLNALSIARRLSSGQGPPLSKEEYQFARGLPFLRRHLDAWAKQRAATSPHYLEIQRLAEQAHPVPSKTVPVHSYIRKDGTHVQGHHRSPPHR